MSDQWCFLVFVFIQGIKKHVRNDIMYGLPWMMIFFNLWGYSAMIFSHDFVLRIKIIAKSPNLWQKHYSH